MWKGVLTALPTPFKDGEVDFEGMKRLVSRQVEAGVQGIVPAGTTGESPLLEIEEHSRIIEICAECADGVLPVIAGCGTNSTKKTIILAKNAEKHGADGILVVTPYYNRPSQEGLFLHFKAVAEEVSLPICLYNVPSRTGVTIAPETVFRLSEMKNIVAIKEASGSIKDACEIIKGCRKDFHLLSGDDFIFLPLLSIGAKGVISVASNILPRKIVELYNSFMEGNIEGASSLNIFLYDLYKILFIETNPVPVKTALSMMGIIEKEFRLPLSALSSHHEKMLYHVLEGYGLVP